MKNIILGIDCSGGMTSLGLASEKEILGETNLLLGRRQSAALPHMVSDMLSLWKLELKDLSVLTVTRGPGFFSGIRVGLSYTLSLAFSLNIPVVSLSSLEVLAFGAASEGVPVLALLPAKRGAYFYGAYLLEEGNLRILEDEAFLTSSEVAERGRALSRKGPCLCVLDQSCSEEPSFEGASILPVTACIRGTSLVSLACRKKAVSPEEIRPSYLRVPW